MNMTRRELRLRAQAEAERAAAEAAAAEATAENAPTPPGGDAGTAGVPLTRRELRQMRLLQETGEIPAVTDEAPPAPPAAPPAPVAAEPAAEAPTLAAAAAKLFITQQALSATIRQLADCYHHAIVLAVLDCLESV